MIGLSAISRRASRHSGYVPRRVHFDLLRASGGGAMFSADGNDQIVRSLWLHGLMRYEAPLPALFMRIAQGAQTILDVGANSGLYAIVAALVEPRCQVHAFEPFPPALKWLQANLNLNGLQKRVTVVPAAAGSELGMADLFIPAKAYGNTLETSSSLNGRFRAKHSEVLKVKVVPLDDYVHEARIAKVSILRADVEGAEHLMMGGATGILRDHRPMMFLEVLSPIGADQLEPFRARFGYRAAFLTDAGLIDMPRVACRFGSFNQLWYPEERRHEVALAADDVKMPLLGHPPSSILALQSSPRLSGIGSAPV